MDRQSQSAAQNKNALYLALGLGALSVVSCFSMAAAHMPAERSAMASAAQTAPASATATALRP